MGTLKAGATYIYERANGQIYAREYGSQERHLIGWDENVQAELLWRDIHKEAKRQPALQKALDNAIMIYRLSKDDPK